MDEQQVTVRGIVRAIEGQEAIIEVEQGGCGRCHEKGGCGGQQLTQMFCSGPKTYRADNPGGARVGDNVQVAVAAGAMRRSANLAYGFPVLGLLLGAGVGMPLAGDPGAMLGGVAGMFLAWLFARRRARPGSGNPENRPYILSRHP